MSRRYVCDVPDCEKISEEVLYIKLRTGFIGSVNHSERVLENKPEFDFHICGEHQEEALEKLEKVKDYFLSGHKD